ncbi:MAG TPA: isopentenyl-diphosphate Delta-isomerase [Spirochaetota bacterium]|nr:isopentenyl-diphosphate Delta-isomerase [Spirochaetota bacterium]
MTNNHSDQLILVDYDNNPTGQSDKLRAHREGLLHRAFSVFLFDSQNRLLIQKRHSDKYHSAGLWSNTCCSHPYPGEDTAVAARRRLREEMGIECNISEIFVFHYEARLDGSGLIENEIDHVFVGLYNGPVLFDPVEIEDIRWVAKDELMNDMKNNSNHYTVWFRKIAKKVWKHASFGA